MIEGGCDSTHNKKTQFTHLHIFYVSSSAKHPVKNLLGKVIFKISIDASFTEACLSTLSRDSTLDIVRASFAAHRSNEHESSPFSREGLRK
ncbi:hypothetical protein AVEN_230066-1 [Araneus ventricosus]|uniref:Uncharacterized protein n=1 Tax=Araneus ventricosus TaxID=182803 RepID=A0A4Y2LCW9_ARAVE|nr:hypothetical protein AVEN_230066-1 [Araneus ventricosus]